MINNNNLFKMKNKTLPTCLQGNYRDSLGEFSNRSYGMFVADHERFRLRFIIVIIFCVMIEQASAQQAENFNQGLVLGSGISLKLLKQCGIWGMTAPGMQDSPKLGMGCGIAIKKESGM